MGSRKKLLAVGDRCLHYDLTFRHTDLVFVPHGTAALQLLVTFEPNAILIAADDDGEWINMLVRELRARAATARIVVVVEAPEYRRASIAADGADYCVLSWLAVIAQDLLSLSQRRGPRSVHPTAAAPTRRRRARLH